MKVEVFLGGFRLRVGRGEASEGRRSWDHKEGEGLRAGGCKRLLDAILDVVGINASDGEEELGVGVRHVSKFGPVLLLV